MFWMNTSGAHRCEVEKTAAVRSEKELHTSRLLNVLLQHKTHVALENYAYRIGQMYASTVDGNCKGALLFPHLHAFDLFEPQLPRLRTALG